MAKIKVNKSEVQNAIRLVSIAVSNKPIVPLLSNILLEVNGDNARLSATNYEIGISTNIPVKSKNVEFTTAIPGKLFLDLFSVLQGDEIDINSPSTSNVISIKSGTSENNIKCLSGEDFPEIDNTSSEFITINSTIFKQAIARIAFAASMNTNSTLNGVLLSAEKGNLVMFATDGFHLSFEAIPLPKSKTIFKSIISSNTLESLAKILDEDVELKIYSTPDKMRFSFGSTNFVAQRLSGNLPDYDQFKSSIGDPISKIVLPTLSLLRACKQLEIFTDSAIKFEYKGMTVELTSIGEDRGDSNIALLANGSTGKNILIGVNVLLLRSFLQVCHTDNVLIEIAGTRRPIMVKMENFDQFYHIIMPMILQEVE